MCPLLVHIREISHRIFSWEAQLLFISSNFQSSYLRARENWKSTACPSQLMKWQSRYRISCWLWSTSTALPKTKGTAIGIVAYWDTSSWELYWNSIFKYHRVSSAIIQLWVWILLRRSPSTAMGWNPLTSSKQLFRLRLWHRSVAISASPE